MWIYRWLYKIQLILQSNLHDTGQRSKVSYIYLSFKLQWWQNWNIKITSISRLEEQVLPDSDTTDLRVRVNYTFRTKLVWHFENRGHFEQTLSYKAVIDILRETDMSWLFEKQSCDVLRKQTWATFLRYRSSYETDLQSDLQPILRTNLHSDLHTDLLADLQDNLQDLQDLQEIYKQICRQYNTGESRQPTNSSSSRIQSPSDLSIHKKMQWLILLELIRDQFLTGQMIMAYWNWFRKWKKKMEILFRGPLSTTNDAVKCNYIIYWSGETGMELVDKWETEDKINDGNRNDIARYFKLFEEHISPKSNALIAL